MISYIYADIKRLYNIVLTHMYTVYAVHLTVILIWWLGDLNFIAKFNVHVH